MWFKQNDPKSPQQPEPVPARPQPPAAAPAAPAFAVETVKPALSLAPAPPLAAVTNSRLTSGLTLKGEVSGREDLWIGGTVEGNIRVNGARVVVGVSGKVHGDIEAREIVVEGGMEGDLHATDRLEITTTGNMRGGATAPRISLQEGALFSGTVEVLRAGESAGTLHKGASASRAAQQPRGSRFQSAQAAGAAAAAGPPAASSGTPAAPVAKPTPAAGSGSTESQDGETSSATSVLHRGIVSETSEKQE